MEQYAMPPLSLATHLTDITPTLTPVAVGPKGFKAALQSLIQFLSAQQVDATLWIKLPKDNAWWEDIWQYGQQAAGSTFYALGAQTGEPPSNLAASLRAIPIEQTSGIKREYLCLAVAPNFVGGVVAIRSAPGTPTPDKRTLKLFTTISPQAVQAVSYDIRAVLEANLPEDMPVAEAIAAAASNPDQTEASAIAAAALSQWERHFPAATMSQQVLPLSAEFVSWQTQQQEILRTELRQSSKQQSQGQVMPIAPDFLGQARRALQSPLTTIKTALTLLGSPSLKTAQRQRYLEMISDQCEHQQVLISSITELLELQTGEHGVPQPIKLSDLIPGIVSTYQPIAEESGIMLAYTIPAAVANVLAVETELKQMVIHLIKNGIQTTPQGGRVWVAAKDHSAEYVSLSVQNSGQALSKTDIDQLFNAFSGMGISAEQVSNGLSLMLVKQLIDRMGGQISVESSPRGGTTFTMMLPATKATVQHSPVESTYSSSDSTNQHIGDQASFTNTSPASREASTSGTSLAASSSDTKAEKAEAPNPLAALRGYQSR